MVPVPQRRPHVVIVGGGFGGLRAARLLKDADVDVTLVDRTNHHLFQPLLYQVATAVLAPSDITIPIRYVLRRQRNATVLMGDVRRIDPDARTITVDDAGWTLSYDYLILAAGARHSYFGKDQWEEVAPGLKSIADAYELRRRFLTAFEEAEKAATQEEKQAWLTFVIVGGGPTGVELAGIIPDTAEAFRKDFRRIDTCKVRVVLLEGGPKVLAAFPEKLQQEALRDLEELRVQVRLDSIVTRVERDAVYVGEERIPTRTIFWAAGNAASRLGAQLGAPVDRAGRVLVEPDLSVPGRPEVFVVGDMAAVTSEGKPVPGVAPAANQMGERAARNLLATLRGQPRQPFTYRNKGDLATIGRHRAIASFGKLQLEGYLAWFLWLFVHILYLVGFRNRVSVLVQWTYAYFTYQRGVRLISGAMTTVGSTATPSEPPSTRPPVPGWK
ncbi:NAD(P)/FAD-dependent oxidoreductase [Roseisolibacter sp. H3M3-2]|uniref:NAD(P)/FAD-dependent oxidoreductase n=1 Tax=Roseisolibacter sp. H3M3-2 TaxID=3031323 RepID=UPI0031F2ED94